MPDSNHPSAQPFLLLFRGAGPEAHQHLTPSECEDMTRQWNEWFDSLAAQGKVQHGHPLGLGGRVVSGRKGEIVTDGPYAEAKEAIGGYFWLSVADLDEATAIARNCPGLSLGITVEVRPVAFCSPVLDGVQARPLKR
ncbi:DGPFAETKE family protein [uncultured Defluviicoccus sp.]|uniref:DGPFAETKE family protein n=1 Tax=metagenome TaxID=256318 RepID=A0A380TA58_9ZZZZ|nr:DGPFAETKE family protein [uncultured Defluviicoccus sp.]